jgi:hypothetical protein
MCLWLYAKHILSRIDQNEPLYRNKSGRVVRQAHQHVYRLLIIGDGFLNVANELVIRKQSAVDMTHLSPVTRSVMEVDYATSFLGVQNCTYSTGHLPSFPGERERERDGV